MSITYINSAKVEVTASGPTATLTVPTGVTTSHFGILVCGTAGSSVNSFTASGWNRVVSNPAGENNISVAIFTRLGGVAAGNTITVNSDINQQIGVYAVWYDTGGRELQTVGTPWTKGGTSQTTITYNALAVPGARDVLLASIDRTLTTPTISSWNTTPTLDAYITSTDRSALGHNVTFAHYSQGSAGNTPTFVETMSNGAGNAVAIQLVLGPTAPVFPNVDFETGSNGTTITAGNLPANSFTSVIGGSAWTYSNAHVEPTTGATLAAKAACTGTAITINNTNTPWTAVTKLYYRFYYYLEVMPNSNSTIATWRSGANTVVEAPRIITTGVCMIRNSNLANVGSSATGFMAAGNFYRFDGMIDVANGQQQLQAYVGSNVNGTVPDYDSGLVTSTMGTNTNIDNFQIGFINGTTGTGHFDNVSVLDGNYGFPGPLTSAIATGGVSATGDAKIWNGTAFVAKPVKVWTGTTWVQKPVKVWNGTSWVVTSY